jgi:hypothetical protein
MNYFPEPEQEPVGTVTLIIALVFVVCLGLISVALSA